MWLSTPARSRMSAAGERPPRTQELDVSLLFRHAACMLGAMRDWIPAPSGGRAISSLRCHPEGVASLEGWSIVCVG